MSASFLAKVGRRLFQKNPKFLPNLCYGQDGEDLILDRFLDRQKKGFFVDVGAHHPIRFSNTYLFYLRGWCGINIDAQPGSMKLFKRYRDRDINVESGVGLHTGRLPFYRFNEPALNTFDIHEAKLKDRAPYKLVEQIEVRVRRLDDLLNEFLPVGQQIDFLTIDVEGKDLEVLESNDWIRFHPRFILAETLRTDMLGLSSCPVVSFLLNKGYRPVAKAHNTTFFVCVES